jgi:hypothetical protein
MKALLLMAALVAANAAAAPIGRLFNTPEERHQLDLRRDTAAMPAARAPAQAALLPEPVTVNGFVKRSGGKSTVWIDDVPRVQERFGGTDLRPTVTLRLPDGRNIQVKAGQTVDLATGSIVNASAR